MSKFFGSEISLYEAGKNQKFIGAHQILNEVYLQSPLKLHTVLRHVQYEALNFHFHLLQIVKNQGQI